MAIRANVNLQAGEHILRLSVIGSCWHQLLHFYGREGCCAGFRQRRNSASIVKRSGIFLPKADKGSVLKWRIEWDFLQGIRIHQP